MQDTVHTHTHTNKTVIKLYSIQHIFKVCSLISSFQQPLQVMYLLLLLPPFSGKHCFPIPFLWFCWGTLSLLHIVLVGNVNHGAQAPRVAQVRQSEYHILSAIVTVPMVGPSHKSDQSESFRGLSLFHDVISEQFFLPHPGYIHLSHFPTQYKTNLIKIQ